MGHKNSYTIFQNPDDQHQFLKSNILPSEKTKLIRGSGVDINLYKAAKLKSDNSFKVLLPARMLWDKGIGEFVEAAKEIQKNSSRAWEFLLAGGLDQENPAAIPEKTVRLWEEAGIVKWLGQCSNMIELFNQVDVVCLPSYREGVPRALLEAAACECPIVTTDAPGCREVVIDKKTGFMVPLKDSRSLVEALEKIAALPDAELKKMGKEGRLLIQNNFTIEHVIDATLDIYTQLQRC
jgi:glycosyltransferase involved in cell wall biosynthesis